MNKFLIIFLILLAIIALFITFLIKTRFEENFDFEAYGKVISNKQFKKFQIIKVSTVLELKTTENKNLSNKHVLAKIKFHNGKAFAKILCLDC